MKRNRHDVGFTLIPFGFHCHVLARLLPAGELGVGQLAAGSTYKSFMLAPVARLIDWSFLQLTSLGSPPFSGKDLGLEEALRFITLP